MFAEWAGQAPADKRREIIGWRLVSLMEASKYGKKLLGAAPATARLRDAAR